jgi:hypothetical protein
VFPTIVIGVPAGLRNRYSRPDWRFQQANRGES